MNPLRVGLITFAKLLQLLLISVTVIFLVKGILIFTSAQSTPSEERKFKKREYVGMPVRVRKVKNLQSETWHNDLEIEVENVSNKPIYFINAVLEFPDDRAPNGSSGILFKFGNIENMDIRRIANTEDERLDPGEKVTLVVDNIYRKGLLARQKKYPHNFKKLEFWFGSISFGDGTGYEAGSFLDLRKKNGFLQLRESDSKKAHWYRGPCPE